jgi:hypothetical protein
LRRQLGYFPLRHRIGNRGKEGSDFDQLVPHPFHQDLPLGVSLARKGHVRIGAKRHRFALAAEAVVPAPILARAGDEEVKAPGVRELPWAFSGFCSTAHGSRDPRIYRQKYRQKRRYVNDFSCYPLAGALPENRDDSNTYVAG